MKPFNLSVLALAFFVASSCQALGPAKPKPTPTPTPVATPVPTPKPTPVPTPVATPVPTPKPTPVPSATPAPTPSPTQTASSGQVLASANFDDGTYGQMTNETPGHNSIIADPTGAGHGKVLQITYQGTNGATVNDRADLNQFISYNPTAAQQKLLGYGATTYFAGDVYFPADTNLANANILRKLTYWRNTDITGGKNTDFVILMWGGHLQISIASASMEWGTYYIHGGAEDFMTMTNNTWYHMEMLVKNNSSPSKGDGSLQLWFNGQLKYSNNAMKFLDQSATHGFDWMTVGHQREGAYDDNGKPIETNILEHRYWDNVVFKTQR